MAKVKWGRDTVVKFLGGKITFSLSADKSKSDYVKDVDDIIARSSNLQPAMEAVGEYLMGSTRRTFEAEGRPKRWQALKPATIADRARKGYPPTPILIRSGKLFRSLTQKGAPGSLLRAGPRSLRYTSTVPYFKTHQLGGDTIPQRLMIVMQKQDASQVSRIINTYIRTGEVIKGGRIRL